MWVDLSMLATVFNSAVGISDFLRSNGPPGSGIGGIGGIGGSGIGDQGGLVGMPEDVVDEFGGGGEFGWGLAIGRAEALGQVAEHRDAEALADADAEGWPERGAVGQLVFGVGAGEVVEAAGGPAMLGGGAVAGGSRAREMWAGMDGACWSCMVSARTRQISLSSRSYERVRPRSWASSSGTQWVRRRRAMRLATRRCPACKRE